MLGCCHVEYETFECQEKWPFKIHDVMGKKKINQSLNKREKKSFPIQYLAGHCMGVIRID